MEIHLKLSNVKSLKSNLLVVCGLVEVKVRVSQKTDCVDTLYRHLW